MTNDKRKKPKATPTTPPAFKKIDIHGLTTVKVKIPDLRRDADDGDEDGDDESMEDEGDEEGEKTRQIFNTGDAPRKPKP